MEYTSGERHGATVPLPGGPWPMTLSRFAGRENPQLDGEFCLDIMKRIERFLASYSGAEGDNIPLAETDVVFLLENSISDAQAGEIERDFRIRGVNVSVMRPDILIAEYYRRENSVAGVVIANSDGKDLDLSVALTANPGEMARRPLPGLGNDPRAKVLAEKIWDQVSDRTIDLRMENEMEVLVEAANRFIRKGRSESDDVVRLSDGEEYDFSLTRSMLPRDESRKIEAEFSGFLGEKAHLTDRSGSVLVLRGDAIGNHYLKPLLSPGFKEAVEMTGALREAVIRLVLSEPALSFRANELNPPASGPTGGAGEGKEGSRKEEQEEETKTSPKPDDKTVIPVTIEAKVEKVKTGLFSKKSVLKVKISSPGDPKIRWRSVVCVQEKPLSSVQEQNIVREYDRGEKLPFSFDLDLPLSHCRDAKRLRVYFKPHPDEPVGINNAYEANGCTVNL